MRATVAEHCSLAVASCLNNITTTDLRGIRGIWLGKLIYDTARFFNVGCELSKIKTLLGAVANGAKKLRARAFFDFDDRFEKLMCVSLLFSMGENERAYNILKFNNPIERAMQFGDEALAELYACDPAASALYYCIVTEKLLGVRINGKRVNIRPHTSRATPHMEFTLKGLRGKAKIVIDDSETVGNWRMRVNKISYATDSIDISSVSDDIVFYRDGKDS